MSTPQTNFLSVVTTEEVDGLPSYTLDEKNILRHIDGIAALKQSLERILLTERFTHTIYDHRYGSEVIELIGKDREYVLLDIERRISEALFEDDRVLDVHSFQESSIKDSMYITFTVDSTLGQVELVVTL